MPGLVLPTTLRRMLDGSSREAPTLEMVAAVTEMLRDNKTPFFPAYTDHGISHTEHVLHDANRLIPPDVWDANLLSASDAAALVCAVLLHDLALHIYPGGFLELISEESRFKAVPWFREPQRDRAPDRPWHQLWADYKREARHFGRSYLDRLLGAGRRKCPASYPRPR